MRRVLAVTVAALAAASLPAVPAAPAAAQDSGSPLAFFHLQDSGEGRVAWRASRARGGAQEFSDVVITGDDGEELHAERLRLAGARQTADGPVFDVLELLNVTGGDGEETLAIARVAVEQPSAALAEAIALALSGEEIEDGRDWGELSDYAFGGIAFEGVALAGEGVQANLAALRLGRFAEGVLSSLEFSGFSGTGTDEDGMSMAFGLDSLSYDGLNLVGADAFAETDFDDEAALQQAFIESGFNDPFRKRYDRYAIEGGLIDVDGVIIRLDSITGSMDETRAGIETLDRLEGLVVEFDASRDTGAQGLQALGLLGYDRIEINSNVGQAANPRTDRVSTEDFVLEAVDAFRLELAYDIGGLKAYVDRAAELGMLNAEPSAEEALDLFAPLVVHGFELRLTDDSLVERALQAAADSQGITVDEARQQATAFLAIGTAFAPPGPVQTLVGQAVGAATRFLEQPGTLRVTIAPQTPVSVADLMSAFEAQDYATALAKLNVSVVAE